MIILLPCAFAILSGPEAVLRGSEGVEAVFQRVGRGVCLTEYRDLRAGRRWNFEGPLVTLETQERRLTPEAAATQLVMERPRVLTIQGGVRELGLEVRQDCEFGPDGRTLRISTSLRAIRDPVSLQRVTLLDLTSLDSTLERVGPAYVSCPIIGEGLFMGVEHPAAWTEVQGSHVRVSQRRDLTVGRDWVRLPAAVIGSAADGVKRAAVKRAFLAYLETIRIQPGDMHIHYNNWWTMPVPFTEEDVLANIAELRAATGGRLYDSYAMDMGWSDPHSVWKVDREGYPQGFARIAASLREMGCEPGLWVSPSSLYPPALDNEWLAARGFEVSPGSHIGRFACLARDGRYQREFRDTLLGHARESGLAHVKFDGLAWPCNVTDHGHPPGEGSYVAIAEGLMEVFDALRAERPGMALEPTCFGYYPSPWWLMHTPFVIGPFGDDSPHGVSPCPEWIESMTTARDAANIEGQDAFWMPSSALECFDVIIQCRGPVYNHVAMAVGRGHWFQSTYVNPQYMDGDEWDFMIEAMSWARRHRHELQNPVIIGGSPRRREPYGYAYAGRKRLLAFVRNPWIEPADIVLPDWQPDADIDIRMLYPARTHLQTRAPGAPMPSIELGGYELAVIEALPREVQALRPVSRSTPPVAVADPRSQLCRVLYDSELEPFGPSWTSPAGDAPEAIEWLASGSVSLAHPGQVCVLVESQPDAERATGDIRVDGAQAAMIETGSRGAFAATGAARVEEWQWFLAPVAAGAHHIEVRAILPSRSYRCGLYVRGVTPAEATGEGDFPLPPHPGRPYSATITPLSSMDEGPMEERHAPREIVHIDGVFLDALEWTEASAGWGEVRRNQSVMGRAMTMGGRRYVRGIGTHAVSRVTYELPEGFRTFAATIGCDQEVWANSVVFVVMADGRELYRSPLMRRDTPVVDIEVPIQGVRQLTLVLEDGGDGINADHGNWADARLLW